MTTNHPIDVSPRRARAAASLIAASLWTLAPAPPPAQAQTQAQTLTAANTLEWRYHKYQSNPALLAIAQKYFPSDDTAEPAKRLARLTRDQIDATVAALLPGYVTQSIKTAMAKDPLQTNYEFTDLLSFNASNLGALSGWIKGIAERVRQKPTGVIDCRASKDAEPCLKAEARKFVTRAFRSDVSAERIERVVAFFVAGVKGAGLAQAASELVEVVLNSPDFLFRKELDVDDNGRLAPAQLLQALTYILADSAPESLALVSAEANKLLKSEEETRAAIVRIVGSKEARAKLMRFFVAWLELKAPDEFKISTQIYPEFNAGFATAIREETDRFLRAELAKPVPKLKDITQATQSYVSKVTAPIYAVSPADPTGNKPIALDPAQRLGIFSQPAVLASHSGPTGTQPIKRGVFWVRKLMCMELDPPPQGLDITLYATEHTTERDRIEQSTAKKACIGCHKVIDPFGFFQESYDALGRWRTKDNGHPIDTSVLIDFLDEAETRANGPVEALRTLTNSMMFKQCFVRQLFRFYMGRNEEPADDPLLRRMFFEFAVNDEQDILRLIQIMSRHLTQS